MKDQFTISLRKLWKHLAFSVAAFLMLALLPSVANAQLNVDIGLYNSTTNANEVEVRVRPDASTTNTLSNIIFTIRWDATAGVNITPGSSTYFVSLQQSGTSGGYNYAIFGAAVPLPVNWTAGQEYTVMTFTYDNCTGFEVAPNSDTYVQANNGLYYLEMYSAQLNHTGVIYNSPLVCLSPTPSVATNPVPFDGQQLVAYNGSTQIELGWDYVPDPLFADPDSFRVEVGMQTFTVPFVPGDTTYSNAVQISPPFYTTVNWTVTPFNADGDASGVATWSFLTAPAPLEVYAMATGQTTICAGDTTSLMGDASGGVYPMSWAWGPSASIVDDTVFNPMVFPSTTTTYTVTITDQLGSTASDEITITVNVPSFSLVSDDDNDTICEGDNTTLIASGATSYLWGNGATDSAIVVSPAQTTTYTVDLVDANGCTGVETITITVMPLPNVSMDTLMDFCVEDAAYTLTSGMPAGGVYSGAGVSGNIFDPASAGVGPAMVTYTYTDTYGCINEASVSFNVNAMPTVDLPDFTGVCVDAMPFALTSGTPAGGMYSGTGVSGSSFDPAAAGVGVHTLYYHYTDLNGCAGMDSATIEVFALPTASAGSDVTICEGECTDLTATGGMYYLWSNQDDIANINVCPTQTTMYTVTVTDMNGCEASASVTVNVNAAPVANAGMDQEICFGECTDLMASGGASYEWSTMETTATINVCPTATETYMVTVTDTNNCTATDMVTVTVNSLPNVDLPDFAGVCVDAAAFTLTSGTPAGGVYSGTGVSAGMFDPMTAGVGVHTLYYSFVDTNGCSGMDSASIEVFALPTADAGSDVTICEGECTDLTASGGMYYLWSNQADMATTNVCPTSTTTYGVTVTDANGCVATDDVTVNVNPLPTVDAGADQTVCAGTCVDLTATGADTYEWSTTETTATINVCPTSSMTYMVTGTDMNGCTNTAQVTVNVNPLPAADAGQDAAICLGDCATLTASGGIDYLWSTGDTTATISVCPTDSTIYTVTVTDANACSATDDVEVIVNPAAIISAQPADVAVDLGASATFTIMATGASYYQWQVSTDGGSTWTNVTDGPVYQGSATAALTIPVTTLNLDGYMYQVELGSPCGPSVVSGTATLSVNSPAISATVPTVTSCADDITVPIIVVKTLGVGAISLTLNYDANVLVYDTFQNLHPSLLNGFLTVVNPNANSVYFSWHSVNPLNILFDTLVELKFHSPNGGTSAINWDLATPGNCEFSDVAANVIPATFIAGSVTAIPSPAVTSNPMDVDITEGQNTSFSVTATNATMYQWQMSADGGMTWYNVTDGAIYQGSTTATLDLYNVLVTMDDYQYRCIVAGTCSPQDTSDAAMMNVRPIITTYTGQITRCADEIIVPIYADHMYGVAGISLTLGFNSVVLNYVGLEYAHPAIDTTGILSDNSTFGKVFLSWYSTSAVDLGDVLLFELRFTSPAGGTSNLVWDLSQPENNEYNNFANEIIAAVWQNGVVHVNPTPAAFNVTGGGEYCDGGSGIMVGLAGSQLGRTYELFLDGTATGQVENGTGGAISFGYQMAGGTYTVLAVNPVTGCDYEMLGDAEVIVNPLPVADAGADISILLGTSTMLDGSATAGTPGYTYEWMPGSMMSEDITVSPTSTTTYTLNVTDSKGCFDDDMVEVTVYENTISGQVTYDNSVNTPLSNVTVYLNDDSKAVVATDVTDVNGNYNFPPMPNGEYTITAATSKPWGGVNSTDALEIMQHFIKIDSLEGLALGAADVDASGYVNTTDAFKTAQRFAQLINSFAAGDWLFEEPVVVLNENNFVTVDFMGLCFGDVNRSHVPAVKASTSLSLLSDGIIPFAAGQEMVLPVSIDQAVQMGALSLVLDIPAGIGIKDVTADYTNDIVWNISNDQVRISWYNANPAQLKAGNEVVKIHVSVSPELNDVAEFTLSSESEIAGTYADVLEYIELRMPKLASGAINADLSLSNYPNPFRSLTNISYNLPEAGNVNLTVYNVLGEKVAQLVNGFQASGQYTVEFDASSLKPGVYQYRLQLNADQESTLTRTMIIAE